MHMAASVGTPVLALFYGTAYPWETGPYGTGHLVLYADEPCAPCLNPHDCRHGHKCRRAITPEHACRAFEIVERMIEKDSVSCTWPDGGVKLFMTHGQAGFDQTLVPINAINKMEDKVVSFLKAPRRRSIHQEVMDNAMMMLKEQGELVIKKFCLGERQHFLEAFSDYVDHWQKVLRYFNGNGLKKGIEPSLSQDLVLAVGEACRALQSEDFVTVTDLLHYTFNPIVDRMKLKS